MSKSCSHVNFEPECEDGNIEYKYKLTNISNDKRNRIETQMKWRVFEGDGIAIYRIGVHDNGFINPLQYSEFLETYINIMDAASMLGYSCYIMDLNKDEDSRYWGNLCINSTNIMTRILI